MDERTAALVEGPETVMPSDIPEFTGKAVLPSCDNAAAATALERSVKARN